MAMIVYSSVMAEVLYTTTDIAEMMNVHITTVQKWIQRGELRAVKGGSGHRAPWVVRSADLNRFKKTYAARSRK